MDRFVSVTPNYTGGGIYVFDGRLEDGNFFMADSPYYDVRIVDADPLEEPYESDFPEWQEEHLVGDLEADDALDFMAEMLKWVMANKPDGNYLMGDMENIAEDLAETITASKADRR